MNHPSSAMPPPADPSIPSAEEQLDILMNYLGEDVARDVINAFMSSAHMLLCELHGHLLSQQKDSAVSCLTELSSSCTTIGARDLSSMCETVELLVHKNKWSEAKKSAEKLIRGVAELRRVSENLPESPH